MEVYGMLTKKENFLETLKTDGKPDRFVNQYEPFIPVMNDPVSKFTLGNRDRGTTSKDCWGTTIIFPENQFAGTPHITSETKVCPDVTKWRQYVKIPDLEANCTDWADALKSISEIDRNEHLVMGFMATGIFEQCHFLMGFEDTLTNLLLEPEAMAELIQAIADYRYIYAKLLIDNLKPDIILSHDDWGTKRKMFFSPQVWRNMLKPHYARIYGMIRDNDVLVMHHADSYLETAIVAEMADIGINVWQGVLPQNDIKKMGELLMGRMALMGGIDAAIVDREDSTPGEIRGEVRRACSEYRNIKGFIPCLTYGLSGSIYPHVDPIITDEIDHCNIDFVARI
jgi:uroporphyrinogen-III decarboxylase